MTIVADTATTITVEDGAAILRGRLIPYNQPAVVADRGHDGKVMLYSEVFDRDSAEIPAGRVPLFISHDESRPCGRILRMWHADDGLQLEAELIGADVELDGWRRRIGAGLLAGLSVGFIANPAIDTWTAPQSRNGLPTVRRRGVKIREGSIVQFPAYSGATVDSIRLRTETQQWVADQMQQRHALSEQVKAELAEWNERHSSAAEAEPTMPVDQPPPAPITEPSPCWSEPIVIDGIVMPTAPERGNYPNERAYQVALNNWAMDTQRVCDRIDRAAERNLHLRW